MNNKVQPEGIDQQAEKNIKRRQNCPMNLCFPTKIYTPDKYGNFKIANGEWKQSNMAQICMYIQQWMAEQMLFLVKNEEKLIFNQIADIKFPKLKQIYIGNNLIESLECMASLYAPYLQVLWIQDNLITSLRPLKRSNFPFLTYFRITQNLLCDTLQLADIQLNYPNSLMLEYNKFGRLQFEDLSPVAKFNYAYKQQTQSGLYAFSMNRIFQHSLLKSLKEKIILDCVLGFSNGYFN